MIQDMHNNMTRNNEITARASRDNGSCPTRLRLVITLLLVLVLGVSEAWAQTTYQYYCLHVNNVGYMRQMKGIVNNDGTFRYENAYDGNGFSIWVYSSDGYLQNEMYYLNVANEKTLYLSPTPVTQWDIVDDGDKKRFQMRNSNKVLGLNSSKAVVLEETPTNKYAACTLTITENNGKWDGPKDKDFTVQSPQVLTCLRTYYVRNITVTIDKNDAGTENSKVVDKKDSRSYCIRTYVTTQTAPAGMGTNWDYDDATKVIYNLTTSNQAVTATYDIEPVDPITRVTHPSTEQSCKVTITPKVFTSKSDKKYLLFNTQNDNYRFPYATSSLSEDALLPVDGKASNLTETINNDLSWDVEVDTKGYCSFKNVATGRYLYYDAADYTVSDYGAVKIGSASPGSDTRYKFRLFSGGVSRDPFGNCYYIIPYDKQFAVVKSDAVVEEILFTLYMNTSNTTKILSLTKASDPAKWKFYAYDWEYRLWTDWNISGEQHLYATGSKAYTASTWFSQNIKGSPANAEHLMLPNSKTHDGITYTWTLEGLTDYISTSDDLASGISTLTATINSLPSGTRSGTLTVKASISSPANLNNSKTLAINLYNLNPTLEEVSSLSQITDANGLYKLTADDNYSSENKPVENFSGTLDGGGHTISGLTAPLFSTLDGGTVRNLNLDNVTINSGDSEGNTGAIACVAKGAARIYNVGILATGSTKTINEDGYTIISSCSSTISGSGYTGGLVGKLDGEARVINCFSYANITGGTSVGGIVGYNNVSTDSRADKLKTMVMNCMFYGDITGGTNKAPIYNGTIISNKDANGVSNFNYFWGEASYVQPTGVTYNCALLAETRFLQRFEFFRHLLNSHRELAAWWATGSTANKDQMMKWVLEPSQIGTSTPYPILKTPGYYPSVVNIDAENAPTTTERNKGGKLGMLSVTIQMGNGEQFDAPTDAEITTPSLTLNITDKDPDHFNFNYYKVQLPYYNDVGTKNYTGNRVVTGWKIVSITGGTAGSFTTGEDAPAYNFADRKCTNKDLYGTGGSNRIFNQGAYWDVPEGVTAITIEPYWAKAAYLADANVDVVYNQSMGTSYNVPNVGGGQICTNGQNYSIAGENQTVYTSVGNARAALSLNSKHTVYDYAIVLVGNAHNIGISSDNSSHPYTIMSADFDHDNEPDYSYILRFNGRSQTHPVRVDFLNIPGLGMAQKSTGSNGSYNFGIMQPIGWFEATNTSLFRVTQFEYDRSNRGAAPLILQGGVMEQWVSGQNNNVANNTTYYHVGGNVWFKEFHRGTHQDNSYKSKHPPISVTGGDFDEFYLTGLYKSDVDNYDDNAECYINGGRFGIVAGAGQEGLGVASNNTGNVTWQIDNADIEEFYGGGINKNMEGNITTVISNSRVGRFCGGPKFGDMQTNKTVNTTASNCIFGTYFGAGYGGNSYSREAPTNRSSNIVNTDWNNWITANYKQEYKATFNGVSTQFNYQFLPLSDNTTNVARIFIEYVKFSLATCHAVTSTLTGCTVTGNFYGGGSLGKVDGNVVSTLTDCTVKGSAYGAGYSASLPDVMVDAIGFEVEPYYYEQLGSYRKGVKYDKIESYKPIKYTWEHGSSISINKTDHILYTTEDLTTLGTVTGKATLNITGTTTVAGSVYGGGEESAVGGDTEVNVSSGTIGTTGLGGALYGNVYGGGKGKVGDVKAGLVKGNTNVNISGTATILHNLYGGGAYGSVGNFVYDNKGVITSGANNKNTTGEVISGKCNVTITGGTIGTNGHENGMVFGSSRGDVDIPGADGVDPNDSLAWVYETHVTIGTLGGDVSTPLVKGSVYGSGENGHTWNNAKVSVHSGTIGIESNEAVEYNGIEYVGARYPFRGNVYGGGCGTDLYTTTDADNKIKTYYNFNAGIVRGNTEVVVDGGHIVHNVYGGGAMGSVGTYSFDTDATNSIQDGTPTACAEETGKCVVTISGGVIGMAGMEMTKGGGPDDYGHVFGAGRGEVKNPDDYPNVEISAYYDKSDVTIKESALVMGSVYGGSESGHVLHDTKVTIAGGQIGCGEGSTEAYTEEQWNTESSTTLKPTNHWTYVDDGAPYDQYADENGNYANDVTARGGFRKATDGHTFFGNVFGGGSGYYPYAQGEWLFSAGRVGGNTEVVITGGHILNNVYGGCEMSDVIGNTSINMSGGTVGVPREKGAILLLPTIGHIFGAGMGDKRTFFNTVTNVENTIVNVSGGKVYGSVHGGGEDGHVLNLATTTIGGNVEIGSVKDGTTSGFDGNVFGGGQGSPTALTAGTVGGNVILNIQGGTMHGSVYGGGRVASVGTFFEEATSDNYGNMQDGDNHGCINVNLKGGTIVHNVYGGCMGTRGAAAVDQVRFAVSKNIIVKLNENVDDDAKGCVVKGDIFGCNNVNSSPQGQVEVHIFKTQHALASKIAGTVEGEGAVQPKVKGRYDLHAVYGGGNMAAYLPKGPDTQSGDYNGKNTQYSTKVVIDGCGKISIQQVYGGGNAASTPATEVTVKGTFEIDELFGGGNGAEQITYDEGTTMLPNPGANVGYYNYSAYKEENSVTTVYDKDDADTKAKREQNYSYGTGVASVNIFGGTIHKVFGGSNTKGNVHKTAVTLLEDKSECEFCVDEVYGGGKSAPMDAETKLYMACIPGLRAAYGGAEAADIQGGVTLNITNGRFDRVFGGNNISGTIRGPIEVNIEETGCKPIIIGELYGGGNLAPYSVYGYNSDGTIIESGTAPLYKDPVVNVKSFTSIGNVFGGGYGSTATMVGNPTVNINVAMGDKASHSDAVIGENAKSHDDENGYPIPSHESGKIGAINNVYGGGNEANVIGSTTVNIGTESTVKFETETDDNIEGDDKRVTKNVVGADIRGNVYGGGNNADVTGNANVVIGKKKVGE